MVLEEIVISNLNGSPNYASSRVKYHQIPCICNARPHIYRKEGSGGEMCAQLPPEIGAEITTDPEIYTSWVLTTLWVVTTLWMLTTFVIRRTSKTSTALRFAAQPHL